MGGGTKYQFYHNFVICMFLSTQICTFHYLKTGRQVYKLYVRFIISYMLCTTSYLVDLLHEEE